MTRSEPTISLQEAASMERVTYQTVRNWVTRGVRGVRLEVLRVGGRVRTSVEAIERFVARLNPAVMPGMAASQSAYSQSDDAIAAALEKEFGI